jgi:DNA-binding MarR family transcriptional regulator
MPTPPTSYNYAAAVDAWHLEFPTLDLEQFLLSVLVIRIGRIVEDDWSMLCQTEFGVSGPEASLLFALRRLGSPYRTRPRDLTRMLLITSGAVVKQIARLAAVGLVERSQDPGSRNGQLIALTASGMALVDRAIPSLASRSIMADALRDMDPQTLEAGTAFCHELVVALEAVTERRTAGRRRMASIGNDTDLS